MSSSYRFGVIGNGGREHALACKLAESSQTREVHIFPGRAAMQSQKIYSHPQLKTQEQWVSSIRQLKIDCVIVGPEAPLIAGLADQLRELNIAVIGPSAAASQLEGSKIFAKEVMKKAGVPTAKFERVESFEQAQNLLNDWPDIQNHGVVIKANGPAGGKGVYVADDLAQAQELFSEAWEKKKAGDGGHEEIFLEQRLYGQEVSVFYLCDSSESEGGPVRHYYMGSAFDHKRLLDGDQGPNTGGMGCVSARKFLTPKLLNAIEKEVLLPTLKQMQKQGTPYTGFLFLGLMVSQEGTPYVIEYNCRLGDPETQTILPLISSDFAQFLVDFLESSTDNSANNTLELQLRDSYATHLVASSRGYASSESMLTGKPLSFQGERWQEVTQIPGGAPYSPYIAGAEKTEEGIENVSGRVFGVTAVAADLESSIAQAYSAMNEFSFEGMHYRRDIGQAAKKWET